MKSQFKINALLGGKKSLEPELVLGGKYVLKSFAGQGGMGEVWRAWDSVGGRFVALKFVATEVKLRDREMQRMQDAFRTAGELNHQHVCPCYGLEFDPKFGLYLAMKWLNGVSLDEIIRYNRRKQGCVPFDAGLQILKSIAGALDYSHSRSILHRDVKPSNIFVTIRNGKAIEVYLIDFGLASLVRDGATNETSGTYLYMSPEQWKGDAQNSKTDLYALGVVAYEMFAGKTPFFDRNVDALRCAVLYDPPPKIPSLPDEVNAVLARCLAKKKDERYETCIDFVRELERASKAVPHDPSSSAEILAPKRVRQVVDAIPQRKNDDAKREFGRCKNKKVDGSSDSASKERVESSAVHMTLVGFAIVALSVAILGLTFVAFQIVGRFVH